MPQPIIYIWVSYLVTFAVMNHSALAVAHNCPVIFSGFIYLPVIFPTLIAFKEGNKNVSVLMHYPQCQGFRNCTVAGSRRTTVQLVQYYLYTVLGSSSVELPLMYVTCTSCTFGTRIIHCLLPLNVPVY